MLSEAGLFRGILPLNLNSDATINYTAIAVTERTNVRF